jgi:hypothetical protein
MDKPNQNDWFGKQITLTDRVICIDDTPEEQQAWKEAGEWLRKLYQEADKELDNGQVQQK